MKNTEPENKIHVPNISLPKGGGAVKGIGDAFQPNAFSGTGSYSIPIPLTPSRGFEPKIQLTYGSGNGNDIFGMGFSLSTSKITIKTDSGIPKYNGSDIYILTEEGELTPKLVERNGQWLPDETNITLDGVVWNVRTFLPREQGAYSLIEKWRDSSNGEVWWKVVSRDNITVVYGRNKTARIADPDDETRIFEWLIEEAFDCKGNKNLYHYKAEDGENISRQIFEVNRSFRANKYLHSVQYGNYVQDGITKTEKYAFEVVFDYGEYTISDPDKPGSNPYQPVGAWLERSDPFSSYRSGFEIRTYRLCRNILIFHNFQELGDQPCLIKALQFAHDETAAFAFLTSVTQTGYRRNPDGSYTPQSLPPLAFEYSQFSPPEAPEFKPLTLNKANAFPGYLDRANFQPVDLKGEGLPGMLFSNAEATFYYEPLGNGAYLPPYTPALFPNTKNFQNPELSLQSLDANGQLELVVNSKQMTVYFSRKHDGSWSAFQSFQSIPTDLLNPYRETADLDGNGKADLLMLSDPDLLFYPSAGKAGYGAPKRVPMQQEFPAASNYGETELVTFANVFGDGLSHRVRIRDGSVEAWPNLGYGRFGTKVSLANAPRFDATTTVSRIFLADIDGSGTTDLVFAYTDRVEVYLNRIGNSFADKPLTLHLPDSFSNIDHIQFADILGEGTSALVFTKAGPAMSHWYYNFCGERDGLTPALKPYLLTKINNNLGAATEIYYASSTKFYLEDKQAGRPWATRLPFPVQVVEKTVVTDEIAGSRLTSAHKYHDGYYDPIEREFRGFGFVESWDTESFEDYEKSVSNPAFPSDRLNKELYVPPVYTKTWHHTGAYFENGIITKQYQKEYFQGDKNAYIFPDSVFDAAVFQSDAETVRQAYAALKGTVMRQEVYALDGSAKQQNPYTATESNVEVQLIQPRVNQRYAVFQVNPRENIAYHYERNPDDPRVQQEFTLEVDPLCGAVKKACTVFLPRRSGSAPDYPEQNNLTTTATYNDYINTPDTASYRFRGVAYQTQAFEIFGLDLKGKPYCSFADVDPVKAALDNPLPYQAPVTPGKLQARQLTWNKRFFWNEAQTDALPLGEIACCALSHHNETAVFNQAFITQVFGPQLSDDTIQNQGGYIFDAPSGYWWNKGLTQFYFTAPEAFYLPNTTENSFVDPSSSLFIKSTVDYDQPYYFSVVKATQYIDEANKIENVVTAQIDYITLQPYQLVDINGNVSQAIFDPLGQVIVTTLFGMENAKPVGGMRLYPYNGQAAEYVGHNDASFAQVLNNPEKYLQGASSYFYYNLLAWKDNKQPPCAINLVRDEFYLTGQGLSEFACKIAIDYSDGFGRALESKLKTDVSWSVSGRTVYNNKGKPCEQYLPYFSNTPDFEAQQAIIDLNLAPPPTVMHYDPLLRVIRVDTPKGFFSKVGFTPWEESHYDENDTVIDSAYYLDFMANYPADPTQAQKDEKDALDKAAKFYNTPAISILDNTGQQIRAIENNLGNVSQDAFQDIVKGTSVTSVELFNDLVVKGYLETNSTSPVGNWVTAQFQPYTSGFVLELGVPYQQFSGPVTDFLKQNGLMSFTENDVQGRVSASIDPRLYYANQTTGSAYYNFKYRYAMGEKDPVYIDSIDAGVEKHLSTIFGNQLWSLSARNYCQLISYDRLQRRTAVRVKKLADDQPIISYADFNRVEVFEYGETQLQAENFNLRGQLYQLKDLAGIVKNNQYSLLGEILGTSRQMAVAYKTAIDWHSLPLPLLEDEIHTSQFTYNALQHLLTETAPDGSVTTNAYNQAGFLNQVTIAFIDKSAQQIINSIDYDAKGQRTAIRYGNGINTKYTYEATTLHLTGIFSTRQKDATLETLQDINYTYDPAGNITRSWNNTFKTVFNKNQAVDPLSDYSYDALYRLSAATGRQHPGINAGTYKNNLKDGDLKQCLFSNLNDAAKLENYSEIYSYDDAGNLIKKQHIAVSSSWNRETAVEDNSNRLKGLEYDASGNLRQLDINNPVNLSFNCCENLVKAGIIQRPDELDDCDYYVYDSNEQRTRKVGERMAGGGAVTLIEEKTYLGNYEITRNKSVDAQGKQTTTLERQTLRIMDGSTCVAIVYYTVKGDGAGTRLCRFQLSDNLGSITAEYDKDAQLITYEEYFPYGGTAIIAGTSQAEVKLKVYRYSGKERDDSTGLYYYGARYYAPWLGRWLNPDPAGTVDGLNLYAFVGGNPITHVDIEGLTKRKFEPSVKDAKQSDLKPPEKKKKPVASKKPVANKKKVVGKKPRARGRKSFYPTGTDVVKETTKENFINETRSVTALLKVNGVLIQAGENGPADDALLFHQIGTENQKGTKINPHAEDWATSSFIDSFKLSGKSLDQYLSADIHAPNTGNSGAVGKHVFSLKINFSPCRGCVETILAFNKFLSTQLGVGKYILRTKFLRPYDLPKSLTSPESEKATNFNTAINDLNFNGVYVRLQPEKSAQKLLSPGGTLPTDFGTEIIHSLFPNLKKDLDKTWRQLGVNRK